MRYTQAPVRHLEFLRLDVHDQLNTHRWTKGK